MIPPIEKVSLCEFRLDQIDDGFDVSLPLPPPNRRKKWRTFSTLCYSIDTVLLRSKDALSEPWLEFDHPFRSTPGVFFRINKEHEDLSAVINDARKYLMPESKNPLLLPDIKSHHLNISHCGFFLGRTNHQAGAIRLNITGSNQWEWLKRQTKELSPTLEELLANMGLCWSATFDWAEGGITRLGFEIYPKNHLQRASHFDSSAVHTLIKEMSSYCSLDQIVNCRDLFHTWLSRNSLDHQINFSHFKLLHALDGNQALKLYLVSSQASQRNS